MTVENGEGTLKEYKFGNKAFAHLFCPTCGTSIMARTGQQVAINLRSFKGVDLDALNVKKIDGAALPPAYELPRDEDYPTLKSEVGEDMKLYHGCCHCRAVTYTVKHKPLDDIEVVSCNCSWCARNGELWIYPTRDHVALGGKEALTGYEFGQRQARHLFCSTCGVSVGNSPKNDSVPWRPINVRTMIRVDLDGLKVKKEDGWSGRGPQYEV